MKKAKRLVGVLTASVMLAGFAVGCGGSASTESAQNGSSDKTQVAVWSFTFKDLEQQKKIADGFNAQHDDIELVFKELPQGTAVEIGEKLVTNLVGGEKIDVFDGNVSEYYNFATKGMLEPLNKYYEADGFDLNKLGESTVEMSKIDGQLYGLPYIKSKFVLYYNKDLFDAAGETYPTKDWTWNDFREAAKRLTKGEGTDRIWGCTMPDYVCTWAAHGPQSGDKFMKDATTPNLDASGFAEGLQFKHDLTLVDHSCPSLAENKTTKTSYSQQFSSGNTAMLISGDWTIGQIATNLNNEYTFEYDICDIPHPEGAEPGVTFGASRYVGINSRSDEQTKQAAWEVVKYLSSEDVAKIMAESNVALPAVNNDVITEAYLANVPDFVTNAKMILEDAPYVEEKAMSPYSNIIEKVMQEEAELALTDAKPVDQAIQDMQNRATEEIKNSN